MFDVGFTEILLIGIVSLIVIGPERLPAVARTAGQWIGKLQRFVRGVKTDLASELETGDLKKLIGDQREQINELRTMVTSAKKDFETTTKDVVKSAKAGLGELEESVKQAKDEVKAVAEDDTKSASSSENDQIDDGTGDTDSAQAATSPDVRPVSQPGSQSVSQPDELTDKSADSSENRTGTGT